MLIVIAFSHRDVQLLDAQAKAIETFGVSKGHSLLVVASQSVEEHLAGFAARLEPYFDRVYRAVVAVPERGFPRAANHLFRGAAIEVQKLGLKQPWLYMEPDMMPVKSGWADRLSTDYNLSAAQLKTRFLGVIQRTTFQLQPGIFEKRDEPHMVGAGVYPHDFYFRSKLLPFAVDEPWDTYMRWEIAPEAAHTELIQHNWNTQNYRRENGQVLCDPAHPRGKANPLRADAVLVHGCKDGSLIRALTEPVVHLKFQVGHAPVDPTIGYTVRKRGKPFKKSNRKKTEDTGV